MLDISNACDLGRVPKDTNFRACKEIVVFLNKFKRKTELVSHIFVFIEKYKMWILWKWEAKPLPGSKMHNKYDKYWGDFKKLNNFMYFAVFLDLTTNE